MPREELPRRPGRSFGCMYSEEKGVPVLRELQQQPFHGSLQCVLGTGGRRGQFWLMGVVSGRCLLAFEHHLLTVVPTH